MPGGRLVIGAAIVIAVVAVSFLTWRTWFPGDAALIGSRLDSFCDEVNAGAVEGLGTVARAASIGSYFSDDAVVDLGQGTAPIAGRDTLIGMAARLQPRTAAFVLKLDDVGVTLGPDNRAADVTLTASFIRRSVTTGEESMDAREFALAMVKDGVWRIKRVTAVDTLK
jgi:hypothetical protein